MVFESPALPFRERDRAGIERLVRYVLRPPVAQGRLALRDDGTIVLELPRVWADGTTHMRFEPNEFLERLVTLTSRPRINLFLIIEGSSQGGRRCNLG